MVNHARLFCLSLLSSVFKGGWPDTPSLLSSVDLRNFFAGDFLFGEVTVGELAGDIRHEDSLDLELRFFSCFSEKFDKLPNHLMLHISSP